MESASFATEDWLASLGELTRMTAPPAGEQEICDQGLVLAAKALGASAGCIVLHGQPRSPFVSWGEGSPETWQRVAEKARRSGDLQEQMAPEDSEGSPATVAITLPGRGGPVGALLLERPRRWDPAARAFARSAGQALASALETARALRQSHLQGETLAQRNVELETLRELTARLQELGDEREIVQAALDLVLEKLGLLAGWVFWGETDRGELRLVACRGVEEGFVRRAQEGAIDDCLCRDVFATGRRMVARDTSDCPRLPFIVRGSPGSSHASVPLRFQRGVLGVMNIAAQPGHAFSTQELLFLETIGYQICLAVDRARTNDAETRRNAEARALATLARAIGGSLEREQVLAAAGDYARELLSADSCAILLGELHDRPLVYAHHSGPPLSGLVVGQSVDLVALGSRAVVESIRDRTTLVVCDTLRDPRVNPGLAARWGIGSQILIPLVARDRLEGVMLIARKVSSVWSMDEVALASALAGQAAVAIENARLYRDLRDNLRRLQDAQYAMMRAERLAAVGTMASTLAHEVRNPLNSIGLQLVLLSRRVAKLDDDVRQELLKIVETTRREIHRLNTLVEEFLSLSSLDRLLLTETDPGEIVREVLELMAPAAGERGILVDPKFDGAVPRIRVDREKIKQVLINLMRNAVEAMPAGGTLGLAVSRTDNGAVIRVSDTGVGIEPGQDVFDFFTTTKRGGTGLGLPISRRIVEVHGGSLSYESAPGRGTVFSVALRSERTEPAQGGAILR